MSSLAQIGGLLLLAAIGSTPYLIGVWRGDLSVSDPPTEKRTHLFETEDGERANPFATADTDREWKYQP